MAHAHTPYKYPVSMLPIEQRQVVMYLTQEEADYLAKLTEIPLQDKMSKLTCWQCSAHAPFEAETIPTTIIRRRIFDALAGVTMPS